MGVVSRRIPISQRQVPLVLTIYCRSRPFDENPFLIQIVTLTIGTHTPYLCIASLLTCKQRQLSSRRASISAWLAL